MSNGIKKLKPNFANTEITPLSMIFLILFTIILGVAVGGLIHLRQQVNHVPVMTRDTPLLKPTEEQKKRLDDIAARWKAEGEEIKKTQNERLAYLNSGADLTDEEKEERYNMNAVEDHKKEHEAIRNREISHYMIHDIYSPELRRKDEERREAQERELRAEMEKCTNEEERAVLQRRLDFKPPSSLGMNLTSKNPNMRRWDMEAESRAGAYVGTIFEWMVCDVMGEPLQEKTFHLIRTSGEHRWIYLTLTREKTESVKDILENHLKAAFPLEIIAKPEVAATWQTWNAAKNAWSM